MREIAGVALPREVVESVQQMSLEAWACGWRAWGMKKGPKRGMGAEWVDVCFDAWEVLNDDLLGSHVVVIVIWWMSFMWVDVWCGIMWI